MKKLIVLSLAVLAGHFYTSACSCLPHSSTEVAIQKSDVVFVGKVIGKKKFTVKEDEKDPESQDIPLMKYTLVVNILFKGEKVKKIVTINTGLGRSDCGYRFEVGKKYIVYGYYGYRTARNGYPIISADICTNTSAYFKQDVEEIKKYAQKKRIHN